MNVHAWDDADAARGAGAAGGKRRQGRRGEGHSRVLELHGTIHAVPATGRHWEHNSGGGEGGGAPCGHDVGVVDQLEEGLDLAALLDLQEGST